MKRKSHGGKREGSGRPKAKPNEKAQLVGLRLYPIEIARLKEHGDTSGAAIRSILASAGIVRRNDANQAI